LFAHDTKSRSIFAELRRQRPAIPAHIHMLQSRAFIARAEQNFAFFAGHFRAGHFRLLTYLASLTRAIEIWLRTVPSSTPKISAASAVESPSISRSATAALSRSLNV